MDYLNITQDNLEDQHICCAIGQDRTNAARAESKKRWMTDRLAEGLVFRRLNDRGKVFVETMPVEKAWKPLEGRDYQIIHCLWVSGRFKGRGHSRDLLDYAVKDARGKGKAGIAVVTSPKAKPFLTDGRFFASHGFQVVDQAPPFFQLMALSFDDSVSPPRFTQQALSSIGPDNGGFVMLYTRQCPFMEEYVGLLGTLARERGIPFEGRELTSAQDIRAQAGPFGTLSLFYKGNYITHELMSEKKFARYLDGLS